MFWIAALATLIASPALAHLTPNSEVRLTVGRGYVLADIIVPQGEYAYATDNPVTQEVAARDIAQAYLTSHFAVRAPDGQAWRMAFMNTEFVQIAGPPDLHAVVRLTPPPGASERVFDIDWHVVVDELPNHFALFVLDHDGGGRIGQTNEILGALRQGNNRLAVDLGGASSIKVLANAMLLGAHHILGGYDHLMFLLALMLPAGLIARRGRWADARPVRDTVRLLGGIVTAFTVGHSLTLVGATLGGWTLPVAPVEVAIAVSVLASALHAIRPIVPGREWIVALLFGLIHGLAFATLLATADAGMASGALSLLGFNLGIEAVQLTIVIAALPALLILSRLPIYTPVRLALAGIAVAASLGWIVNRTTGALTGLVGRFEGAMAYAGWLVIALSLIALALLPRARKAQPT